MADILFDFPIGAPTSKVYRAITTPAGLDEWWTKRSKGEPIQGSTYELWFGPKHDWRAKVTKCVRDSEFELEMTGADKDWTGTRIGFRLLEKDGSTTVQFYHTGWSVINEHYRISAYCWAMYLRILSRYLEQGETVSYEKRLDV